MIDTLLLASVILSRSTLAATSPMAYEVLSMAFEDGQADWVDDMLDHGTAVRLATGTPITVAGVNLRARPISATVVVNGRRLFIPRSALERVNP